MKQKLIVTKRNKILCLVILFLIIIAIILFNVLHKHKIIGPQNTSSTITSDDSTISVTIPDKYHFSKVENESYNLVLNSSLLGSNIYFSEISTANIRDIFKFIEGDKNDYISKFPNISDVSDITETTVLDQTAYTYNFHYKGTMYVAVYWILRDDKFTVIDFNINTEKIDKSIIDKLVSNTTLK